jgi:hypothetical protein
MKRVLLFLIVLGGAVVNWSFAGQPGELTADQAAVRKADDAYVKAFNKHDAKALADAWSPEAVYLSRVTGDEVVGRAAIAEQFAALFGSLTSSCPERGVDPVRLAECRCRARNAKTLAPTVGPRRSSMAPF